MEFTVKCPYCRRKQTIHIDLKMFENGYKYFDCLHCLDCFEVELKATGKWIEQEKPEDNVGV